MLFTFKKCKHNEVKWLFISVIIIAISSACKGERNESKTLLKEVDTVQIKTVSQAENKYTNVERSLKYDVEKFGLLAKCYNYGYDTLYSIIREYEYRTSPLTLHYYSSMQPDSFEIVQSTAIDSIADNFGLNKQTVGRIIFAFKYEMITKKEIGLKAVDNYKDEAGNGNQ